MRSVLRSSAPGLLILALFLFAVTPAGGQAVTGTIVGTVTDSTGAAVANVTVTIREMNTGLTRSTVTSDTGTYSFPATEPGIYSVSVERQGFRKAIRDKVELLVNSTVRADLTLTVGAVNESVTVLAEVAAMQTDRADTGRKLEEVQLQNMPLGYGRNFQSLLNLVPGTTRAFEPHSEFFNSPGSLTTQVNGVQRQGNNVQFEGVDNNHRTGLLTVLIPPIDAIETVDVSTSNYEAEMGRAGGAVTNIQLKSGTNDWHGSLYEYNKVSKLGARETFAAFKPVTTVNNYGFTIGGPIRKNKTFIFGDYQAIRDRRGDANTNITVPGQAFRNGDFSSVIGSATIYDPQSGNLRTGAGRTAFPNNIIPAARISPIAQKILNLIPLPNVNNNLTNNFANMTTRSRDVDSFDTKVDHQLTDKDRFTVRYSFQRPVVTDPGIFGIAGGGGKGFAATGVTRTQAAAINYFRLFSPTLITEARVGLSRYSNKAQNLDYGTKPTDALGIKGINIDDWTSGLTQITLDGYSNPLIGYSASLPWNRAETNFDFVNNWTKVMRNHTIKWGANVRRLREELLQTQDAGGPRGQITFSQNQTSGVGIAGAKTLNLANALAAMLVDDPSQLQRDAAIYFPSIRNTMVFLYAQDKWQVSPKLTVDIGLRWELYPPFTPRFPGGFSNYDPATNNWNVAGYGSFPMNMGRKTYYTDFAPRVGFAYRLNAKTVVRAGAGISWSSFPDNKYAWDNFPVKQNAVYNNTTTGGQAQMSDGTLLSMATGFPTLAPAVIPSSGIIPASLTANVNSYIPTDYHESYVESWNFAVQRQLPHHFTWDVAYVANHTVRGPVQYDINASMIFNSGSNGRPLYQKFGRNVSTLLRYDGLSNNYNSLQTKLDRRFSSGFVLTTSYTYSKAMGYGRTDDASGLWDYIDPKRSYAKLDFDRTHTFVQSYLYELPFGPNKHWLHSGPGRWLFGDWQLNGVLTMMSGRPFTIGSNVSINTPGSPSTADLVGNYTILHGIAGLSGSQAGSPAWFDPSVFVQPLNSDGKTPHFGNTGYNEFTGPGLFDLDFSVFRRFPIRERYKLEFRAEALNLTNTPAFSNPSSTLGSADFGRVTSTMSGLIANQGAGGTGPRQIQFALKLTF